MHSAGHLGMPKRKQEKQVFLAARLNMAPACDWKIKIALVQVRQSPISGYEIGQSLEICKPVFQPWKKSGK